MRKEWQMSRRGDSRPRGGRGGDSRNGEWLYGRRPVLEVLRAGRRSFYDLCISESAREACSDEELAEIRTLASHYGVRVRTVDRKSLNDQLGPVNHQGVAISVSSYPYKCMEELMTEVEDDPEAVVLILDHIEDPQNVGSLLRTADAAGVKGVIIPEDRSAGVTPAAVRASAGAAEHLCVVKVVNIVRAIEALKEQEVWVTGLDFGDDAKDYADIDYKGRCALVVGNEGRGISRLVREKCDFIAMLPMVGAVSSLNASVAGALVMYEALRQKR